MAERRSDSAVATADREIVITRVIHAPRDLVWSAWTDPKQVVQWWGPTGFTTTIHEMDVRPGGVWRHTMHGPDGTDYPNHSVFIEVMKPERIVFSHGGGKEGAPGVQFQSTAQFQSTWTFDALGDKTQVTIRMVFASAAERDRVAREFGAVEGGNQTLGRMEEFVATAPASSMEREVEITRIVDAPRELVFNAWIDPEHLKRWWGPTVFTNPVCEVDARVGGAWHIVMRGPDGAEYPCGGVYQEIVASERLVFTNIATDTEGKLIIDGLTIVTFAEDGGKTKLPLQTRGVAVVPYAAAYLKGMEAGWTQSLERLAQEVARR
jgi:uncharacterized protein YndB with AHSA1/START domain